MMINIDKYKVAANITEYHIDQPKNNQNSLRQLFHLRNVFKY